MPVLLVFSEFVAQFENRKMFWSSTLTGRSRNGTVAFARKESESASSGAGLASRMDAPIVGR